MLPPPIADPVGVVVAQIVGLAAVFSKPLFVAHPVPHLNALWPGAITVTLAEARIDRETLAAMGTASGLCLQGMCIHHYVTRHARIPAASA